MLEVIRDHLEPGQRIFVGVVSPIDPRVETAEAGPRPRARGGASTSRSRSSAPPTTAGSRRSATTRRPRATPRSRRSRPACAAPRWPRRAARATLMQPGGRGRSCCARSRCKTCRASCAHASAPSRSCIKTKEALEEERRILELLNETGATLASKLDLQSVVQTVTDAATQLSGAQFGAFFYTACPTQTAMRTPTLRAVRTLPREAFEQFGHPRATPLFAPTFRGEGVDPDRRRPRGSALRADGPLQRHARGPPADVQLPGGSRRRARPAR